MVLATAVPKKIHQHLRVRQAVNYPTSTITAAWLLRVIGILAAILTSLHMQTADDFAGINQPVCARADRTAGIIQWAERIMQKIDSRYLASLTK
jgi:hypothetical protein